MSEESVLAIILHRLAMAFKGLVGPASKTLFLILIFSLEITAEIKGPPVVEKGYTEKFVAEEDDVVKLNCPIMGNPKPIIEWYQDDQLIHSMWDRERFRINRKTLKIKGVTLADSGVFECKGVNGFGSISVQIHLVVKNRKDIFMKSNKIETLLNEVHSKILVPKQTRLSTPANGIAPQIIHTTSVHGEAIHKRAGDTLRLECQVDGIPPPSIVWYKDGDILLTPNSRSDRTQTLLLIPNLRTEDAGIYWCKSRNVWGEVNATFPVKIYEELEPPQILGPLSSSNQENYTVLLGGQTTLQCAVRSLGPTQIQWLKQLHDHQAPTDRNKTIVVFDFIFEILEPTSEMKDAGGIHNTTLKIGPPAQFMQAGRYICLVNNPEGHAHKEIFVRVLTDQQIQSSIQSEVKPTIEIPEFAKEASKGVENDEAMPLAVMILVPILSSGLILVILAIVCIRRQTTSGSVTASPLVKTSANTSSSSNGSRGNEDSHHASNTLQTLKRLSSLHHFYAKPWATQYFMPNEAAMRPKIEIMHDQEEEDGESWVEVTNKANQTPSHWVYTDMTIDEGTGELIYPFSTPIASQSTFNSYVANTVSSTTNSPRFIQRTISPYQPIYSNDGGIGAPPPPPPYPPHLSTVMPLRTRSPLVQPRFLTANLHTAAPPPTMAPPPAPGSTGQMRRKRNQSDVTKPPFYALVKDTGSELYARPPSDHFYFKITDGKTEFI